MHKKVLVICQKYVYNYEKGANIHYYVLYIIMENIANYIDTHHKADVLNNQFLLAKINLPFHVLQIYQFLTSHSYQSM